MNYIVLLAESFDKKSRSGGLFRQLCARSTTVSKLTLPVLAPETVSRFSSLGAVAGKKRVASSGASHRWIWFLVLLLVASAGAPAAADRAPDPGVRNAPAGDKVTEAAARFIKARQSLEIGEFDEAVTLFTKTSEELPLVDDYVLYWRSRAYEGKGDTAKALSDLSLIRKLKPETPLLRKIRRREIEIAIKTGDREIGRPLREFVKDYPGELDMKITYARHLKRQGDHEAAKKLFREVYITASPLSEEAEQELSPAGITVQDIVERGKNLNAAFRFGEAEQCFRTALQKDGGALRAEIDDGLARSLFRQKRYSEAAELYKKRRSLYWYARSLLRSGQFEKFEAELPRLRQHRDDRLASVFISYGNIKRRAGDTDRALSVFREVAVRYPGAREEALWAIGWTHYRTGSYETAIETFSNLQKSHGDTRYQFWKDKCREHLGDQGATHVSSRREGLRYRDFYGFLSLLSREGRLPVVTKSRRDRGASLSPRADILIALGLVDDAAAELLSLSRKAPSAEQLVSLSLQFQSLGKFNSALSLISRTRYNEGNHELFYPIGYWDEVESASRRNNVDPLLVLSVIREESRFDPEARSVAGAVGLMQLMPKTGERYSRKLDLDMSSPDRLADPGGNVLVGSHYLAQLLLAFESIPVALAAYNAGEEIVSEWLRNGNYRGVDEFIEDIPYDETRNYVKRVLGTYMEYLRGAGRTDPSTARKLILKL